MTNTQTDTQTHRQTSRLRRSVRSNRQHAMSPNNMINTSVFSYLRTLKTWHYPHLLLRVVLRPSAAPAPAVQQSINVTYEPGPQQQTRRTLPQRANGTDRQTDKRTDGRTPYRFIAPAAHTMRAVLLIYLALVLTTRSV